LNDLSLPQLLDGLAQLPSHSAVIYGAFFKDAGGRPYTPAHICPLITASSNAPVYGSYETLLGCGIVGGSIINIGQPAYKASDLALRILNGEAVTSLPVLREPPNPFIVDWRQLKRWNIPESRLPAGTHILYGEISPWERYRKYLLAILAIVAIQSVLIALLIVQVRRRKRSEKTLRQLSGRILTASEDERKYIARELHDDIGQQLAIIALDLVSLGERIPPSDLLSRAKFEELYRELDAVTTDLHHLSHQLHSAKLEYFGLAVTLRELTQQVAQRHELEIDFQASLPAASLPSDVSLCFYRVAQEALTNVVKHSHATEIEMTLTIESGRLWMKIKDNGDGFDPDNQKPGLGLVAMQERLRMIGGALSIVSRASAGTLVVAEARVSRDKQLDSTTSLLK
jgi:signal transduction histidine kinase